MRDKKGEAEKEGGGQNKDVKWSLCSGRLLSRFTQTSERLIPPRTVHRFGEEESFIHNLSFFTSQILPYVLLNPPCFRMPICSHHMSL